MMLDRPLIDARTENSFDTPFRVCDYHWAIISGAYRRYLVSLDEAKSLMVETAKQCSSCETPSERY